MVFWNGQGTGGSATLSLLFFCIIFWKNVSGQQNVSKSCPGNETIEELQERRLQGLQTYVNAAGAIGPFHDWTLQETTMEQYLDPQANISVKGVGVFTGRQESIEYAALTNPSLNGQRLAVLSRDVINTTWVNDNKLQIYSNDSWQINETNTETGETHVVKVIPAVDQEFLTYVDCNDTIIDDYSIIDDDVNNAIDEYVLSRVKPEDICFLSQIACAGALYPFADVADCIDFMYQIPTSCNDGVNFLLGNTSYCRFLHATAAQVNPVVHCPHVMKNSTFCVQEQCINQEYGPLPKPFFGEYPDSIWDEPAVTIIGFLIAFIPSIVYGISLIVGGAEMRHLCNVTQGTRKNRSLGFTDMNRKGAEEDVSERLGVVTAEFGDAVSLELEGFGFQTLDGVTLLHSIHMEASGGDLVAVMGPSGAGKTTLLKCLSKRNGSGKERGLLAFGVGDSGKSVDLAFVEQNTAGMVMAKPELTVAESLIARATFLFKLQNRKRSDIHEKELFVKKSVQQVMALMGLSEFLNTKLRYLSGGQQKRYRIAMELLSNPSVMLLDEPTSGLDSKSALELCQSLHILASNGMLVIMNIHQPNDLILDLCSSILLMKKGGYQVLYDSTSSLRERVDSAQAEYNAFDYCPEKGREKGWISNQARDAIFSSFALYDGSMRGRMSLENRPYEDGEPDSGDLTLEHIAKILQQGQHPLELENAIHLLKKAASDTMWSPYSSQLRVLEADVEEMAALPFLSHHLPPFLGGASTLGETLLYIARKEDIQSFLKSFGGHLPFNNKSEKSFPWSKAATLQGRFGLSQWLSINTQLSWEHWKGTPVLDKVVYAVGCLVAAGFMCLLFPFIGINSTRGMYGFPSSLLILIAICSNLVFLNQIQVRINRERALLAHAFDSPKDSFSLRVINVLLCASASNAISLVLMFFLYYFVVRWNIITEFHRVVSSFISLKIIMDTMSIFGTIAMLYLPQSASLGLTGGWLGWNVVFAGVLIRLQDIFVLWKYWSFYVTPFYHLINVWMWQAFYLVSDLNCQISQVPGSCPQTGNLVLESFGYSAVPSSISLIVLFGTEIIYGMVLAFILLAGKRLHFA